MGDLQNTIQDLANNFAQSVLQALSSASLEDISGMLGGSAPAPRAARAANHTPKPRKARAGGGAKRSPEEIQLVVDELVTYLKANPDGIGSEHLQKALGIEKKFIVGPIAQALDAGLIKKTGEKRATRYFPGGAARSTKAPKPAAAKKAKVKAKAAAPKKAKAKVKAKAAAPKKAKAAKPKKAKAAKKHANGVTGAATPASASTAFAAESLAD